MVKNKNRELSLTTLDRALLLFKKYWFLVAIGVLTIGVAVVSFSGNAKLVNLLVAITNLRNNFRKEVETIDTLADKKTAANTSAVQQHSVNVIELQNEKQKRTKQVEDEKQEEVKVLKKKTSRELAGQLKTLFKLDR